MLSDLVKITFNSIRFHLKNPNLSDRLQTDHIFESCSILTYVLFANNTAIIYMLNVKSASEIERVNKPYSNYNHRNLR